MTALMTLLSRLFRDDARGSPITPELCSPISSMVLRVFGDRTLSKLFESSGRPFQTSDF
jgi:hypothetical protein